MTTMNLGYASASGNICLAKAGLAEGTNSATIKTAAPNGAGIDYVINGYLYHKADTDNIAMTACAVQAVATTCMYLVEIDSSGNVSLTKGEEVSTTALTNGAAFLSWPAISQTTSKAQIGAFKLVTDATHTFTSGTTDLSATGITATFYDFPAIPPRAPT